LAPVFSKRAFEGTCGSARQHMSVNVAHFSPYHRLSATASNRNYPIAHGGGPDDANGEDFK
jgi:hypothetical protein